ncbi:DUF2442 domain-containing protein [Rhizobium halophytocola]|uniref:DUF2442 domain-containing protein n=1 Tax=Rhizobium halophytocola TaxID=735519 RepID=A0ABS4DTT9_9HYPH|nr:DUF2442 domain-containing protein [Rhizobium halophytocola]MBP1849096.1 hypothetical protein [Rhizobium halophytocola]
MSILDIDDDLLEPVSAYCTETGLVVLLGNGTTLVTPLWWYPPLLAASTEQRNAIELSPYGIHWPALDEDLSIEGMLQGARYPDAKPPAEAAE